MQTIVTDLQTVPEVETQLFDMLNNTSAALVVMMENRGVNTINYRFQEFVNNAWADIGEMGDDTYTTLMATQARQVVVSSEAAKVRLVGNASGASTLFFSVCRQYPRSSGGSLPLISY